MLQTLQRKKTHIYLQSEETIPNQCSVALNFLEYRVLAETRILLKLVIGGVRVVAKSVLIYEQAQSDRVCCFQISVKNDKNLTPAHGSKIIRSSHCAQY